MRHPILPALLLLSAGLFAGCGSGGGPTAVTPAPAPAAVESVSYFDAPANTLIESRGLVQADAAGQPTTTRIGTWTAYFPPADGHGIRSRRTYVAGTWDQSQPWCEWNADGSVRSDSSDY